MLNRARRAALVVAAAAMAASSWAGFGLDPRPAAADAPWSPAEPPAPDCTAGGLNAGEPCVESSRHVEREHTYVFDASIWGNYMENLVCHQPPYIDPIGPGTGGIFDDNGILIATNPAEFQKTVVIRRDGHTPASPPASVEDWEEIEGQSFYGDFCALQMENFYTVESYDVSPASPHEFTLSTFVETCSDDQLLSLIGRPSSSSGALTPAFSPSHVGYYLGLESNDGAGWLAAVAEGCATLQWLTSPDSTIGSWHVYDVALGADRSIALRTGSDDTFTDFTVYAVLMSRAGCAADEHHHGDDACHPHPQPDCTESGLYEIISGEGHIIGFTAVCDDTVSCASDEHSHGLIGCHPHPPASCGTYTTIVGPGHGSAIGPPCDPPEPTCTDHQHLQSPGIPGTPGEDANDDGDYDDPDDTPPIPGTPATYYNHAHCAPLCTWPVGAHYLIHTGGDDHDDAYELCPAASAPSVACTGDGIGGHGDAVRVTWTDGPTASFDLEYQFTRAGAAFGSVSAASTSSSSTQLSFDTASLDASFGSQSRGVRVRVSALRYSWSSWRTISCGISCTAALDNLASDLHVIAGSAAADEPRLSRGLTQVTEPNRDNLMYVISVTTGIPLDTAPSINECAGRQLHSWHWQFSPAADFLTWTDFVGGHTACTTGGSSCRYQVVDARAVGNTFTVTATPQGRTKLTGRTVAGSPVSVTVRVGHIWLP